MNIVFIGCVESSYVLLKTLIKNDKNIVGVVTKGKSAFNSDFASLISLCEQHNIPYILQDKENTQSVEVFIKNKKPDLLYCFGWSHLLPDNILNTARVGCIGFHPAELPDNKGRHPLIWALVLGLERTASSFFLMTDEADAGGIISQKVISIEEDDDSKTLYEKVLEAAQVQVLEFTDDIEKLGKIRIIKENIGGNAWRKRGVMDGSIDWRMSSRAIYNLVRGLTHPYAGAHFVHDCRDVKVWKVAIWTEAVPCNYEPGKIIEVFQDHTYLIKTYDGAIHVLESEEVFLQAGEYL